MSNENEDEPTPAELAEAAALAAALELPAPAAGEVLQDSLAVVGLLRHARTAPAAGAPVLAPERLDQLAARVLPAVDARRPRRRRWLWLTPALLAPLAAATLTIVVWRRADAPVRALPLPPVALLEAQGRTARGGANLAALDAQMRDYRVAFYAALAGHEGGGR